MPHRKLTAFALASLLLVTGCAAVQKRKWAPAPRMAR